MISRCVRRKHGCSMLNPHTNSTGSDLTFYSPMRTASLRIGILTDAEECNRTKQIQSSIQNATNPQKPEYRARHPNTSNTKITNIGECLVPQDVISPTFKNCIWDESVDCLIVAIQAGYRTTAVQQRLAIVLHIRSHVHQCSADARANRVCVLSSQNKKNSSPMSSSSLQTNDDPFDLLLQCPPMRGMTLNDIIWDQDPLITRLRLVTAG